ncbi:hypothetical protein [Shimia isoporae]|uniref:hypothetical protein n=1 Tax=Shimia isoporae TaxID=647720 RepID=UPI00104A4181|nr:hypothetical protein [Shimia isoporae]
MSRLVFEGKTFWVKQRERVKGSNRIFKHSPAKRFKRELQIHMGMIDAGAPVPEIVLAGEEFVVFADAGPTLQAIWSNGSKSPEEKTMICFKAGQALAELHNTGNYHGRPAARDLCWDGSRIVFLDFEHHSKRRDNKTGRALDVICFVHNLASQKAPDSQAVKAVVDGYRDSDRSEVWQEACSIVRRYGWLEILTRPIQARKDPHALEFKSLPGIIRIFSEP